MNGTTISCPNCHGKFELTAAIEQPIVEKLRAQFDAEAARKDDEMSKRERQLARQAEELKKQEKEVVGQVEAMLANERDKLIAEQKTKAQQAVRVQLADLQEQLREKDQKLDQASKEQLTLLKQQRELEDQKKSFELDKARQIDAEREKIRKEAEEDSTAAAKKTMEEYHARLEAQDKMLAESRNAEIKLRKEKLEAEERIKAFNLEQARRDDEVRESVSKAKDEEHRLKEAEKNKQLEQMKQQIDELKRKAEQGSQQAQGEVLELDLEAALRRCFGRDDIVPVGKGVQGGDLHQHVKSDSGKPCGTIIWESKRTRAWSDGWITKLKDDQLAARAQIAVIVSVAMPKDIPSFDCRDNVWICPPKLAVPLATALRHALIETSAAKRSIEGRHEKIELVYAYLSGSEFKNRVNAIVEAFQTMRNDLETEKAALQRAWAKREKQLERVLASTAGMYGELSGIIGDSLPAISRLELPSLVDATGEIDGPDKGTTLP